MATILGTNGNDLLTGTTANDVILGLPGDDTITDPGGLRPHRRAGRQRRHLWRRRRLRDRHGAGRLYLNGLDFAAYE